MTKKQFLAGIITEVLFQLQMATSGRCGLFNLYGYMWQIYTDNYKTQRAGFAWDMGWKK